MSSCRVSQCFVATYCKLSSASTQQAFDSVQGIIYHLKVTITITFSVTATITISQNYHLADIFRVNLTITTIVTVSIIIAITDIITQTTLYLFPLHAVAIAVSIIILSY